MEFCLSNAKPSAVPLNVNYDKNVNEADLLLDNKQFKRLVGCLLYVAVNSRPDIAASVSILAQRTNQPRREDWTELKNVVRYLNATAKHRLAIGKIGSDIELIGYADANWAENRADRKSNSCYVFFVYGGAVSWACRKQSCVALSSTEAEYISGCSNRRQLPYSKYEDNQSCLKLIESEKISSRTKHIDTKRHYVKDLINSGAVQCVYCPTQSMFADMFTKSLSAKRLLSLREACGIREENI